MESLAVMWSGLQGSGMQGFNLTILGSTSEFSCNLQGSDLTTVSSSIIGSLPSSQGSQGFDLVELLGLVGEELLSGSQGFDLSRGPQGFDLMGLFEQTLGSLMDSAEGSTGMEGSVLGSIDVGGSVRGSIGLVLVLPRGGFCSFRLAGFNLLVALLDRSPWFLLGSIQGSVGEMLGEFRVWLVGGLVFKE